MMRAEKPPRSVIEEMAREGFRRRFPEGMPQCKPPTNAAAALLLLEAGGFHIPYRGRLYKLGHVSFEDGLRLVQARTAVEALDGADEVTDENRGPYLRAMRLIVSMAPRYLLPVRPVRRLFWRLRIRRNPFRSATDAEVGLLLGFFLASRMRSRVQYRTSATERELVPTS